MRAVPRPVAAVAALAAVLLTVPLVALLIEAPWASMASVLTDPATGSALRVSLTVSVVAAALSVLLGVPLA